MQRRDFIKLSAAAGMSVLTPWGAHAGEMEGPAGQFWVTVNLRGGWDTTLFCEPRGSDHLVAGAARPVNLAFTSAQILSRPAQVTQPADGNPNPNSVFRYGPDTLGGEALYAEGLYGVSGGRHILDVLSNPGFTVINGVDAGLTSHAQGERLGMSGALDKGSPTLAALVGAHRMNTGDPIPMPLLTFGGYDATGDLVAPTRLSRLGVLKKVTRPNMSLASAPAGDPRFHDVSTATAIEQAVGRRLARIRGRTQLPGRQRALNRLFTGRLSQEDIGRFATAFVENDFNRLKQFEQQIYVSLLGFSTGIAASAGLVINGWDSHRKNDYQQSGLYRELFGGLAYLRDQATALGIIDRLNVVVISEFSRTPAYNENENGKDHHSVGSWMTMLWGSGHENGIRVVGGTDDNVLARRLTEQATFARAGQGEKLTPSILHNELRHVAGLAGTDTLAGLELDVPRIRIWG